MLSPVFADTGTSSADAFCSSSTICGAAPKEFTLLMDLSRDLLLSIKTQWTAAPYLGKYVNPNWFQWDTFAPPSSTNIVGKLTGALQQIFDFSFATTAIFTSPQEIGWVKDVLAWVLVLFKDAVFLRDMRTLENMQSLLTQKKYELGVAGGWFSVINEPNRNKIQAILDIYKKKWLLTGAVAINNWALYNHITSLVGGILSATQSFLYLDPDAETDPLSPFADRSWAKGQGNPLQIFFSPVALASMDAQYGCARGATNICSKSFAAIKDAIKIFGSAGSSVWKSAVSFAKKISDASKRLAELFSSHPSPEFKRREKELLTSYYGNQAYAEKRFSSLTGFLSSLVSVSAENSTFPLKDMFKKWRSSAVDTQTIVTDSVKTTQSSSTTSLIPASSFDGYLVTGLSDVLKSQHRDLQSVLVSDVKDFTAIFTVLGEQIHKINTLIGTKDDWLLKSLATSASLQCSQ